jgi:DNA-binding MarR family transcriptional regulator
MSGAAEKLASSPDGKQSLRLWLRIFTCSTMIEKKVRAMLTGRFAKTLPRFDVLAAPERRRLGLAMSELSGLFLVSNGNVTAIISRLLKGGLVTRVPETTDRRMLLVTLTPKGRRGFRVMASAHESWIEALLCGLGGAKIDLLLAGLNRVKASIERSGL